MRGQVVMDVTHREACASQMFYMVIWHEAQLRSACTEAMRYWACRLRLHTRLAKESRLRRGGISQIIFTLMSANGPLILINE